MTAGCRARARNRGALLRGQAPQVTMLQIGAHCGHRAAWASDSTLGSLGGAAEQVTPQGWTGDDDARALPQRAQSGTYSSLSPKRTPHAEHRQRHSCVYFSRKPRAALASCAQMRTCKLRCLLPPTSFRADAKMWTLGAFPSGGRGGGLCSQRHTGPRVLPRTRSERTVRV